MKIKDFRCARPNTRVAINQALDVEFDLVVLEYYTYRKNISCPYKKFYVKRKMEVKHGA